MEQWRGERAADGTPEAAGSTRIMPPLGGQDAAPARGRRGRVLPVVTGCLVVVAVVSLVVVLAGGGDPPPPAPRASSAAVADDDVADEVAEPAPSSTPVPGAPGAAGPLDPLFALQDRLDERVAAGALDSGVAEDVRKDVVALAEAFVDGDTRKVTRELRDIRRRLDRAVRRGDMRPDPQTTALLQNVHTALGVPTRPNRDERDDDDRDRDRD
ncbi:hypothetical protein LO762_09945 [Actinocorallia sp. API 0066]|uniref:hypothetical protein n=1 Tax=Actinocorallia sp. API 0066 TaxID=2896846 RepID=UPI001E2D77D8|nr:hypothetical protein [Actinocorallia sp. API 0066]MCD0449511.1 hypothetical protein [Actinocorallia sp. API 0066]